MAEAKTNKNEQLGMLNHEFLRACQESKILEKGYSGNNDSEKLYDRDGNFMFVWNYDGIPMPIMPFVEQALPNLPNFPVRDDDVFICAFPSSGTHWFWEMTCMLLREKAEYLTGAKEQDMLEFLTSDLFEKRPSTRVLNTHLRPKHLPEKMVKEGKIILVVRNPKDVVVSNYRQTYGLKLLGYDGSFPSFFELFLEGKIHYGSWFDYINDWMEAKKHNPNILLVTYEDAKKDLLAVLKRLSSHLNLELNIELIKKIAELGTFNSMKAVKESEIAKMGMFKEGSGFYRSGKAGTWKDWLSLHQHERLEKCFETELKSPEISRMYHTL